MYPNIFLSRTLWTVSPPATSWCLEPSWFSRRGSQAWEWRPGTRIHLGNKKDWSDLILVNLPPWGSGLKSSRPTGGSGAPPRWESSQQRTGLLSSPEPSPGWPEYQSIWVPDFYLYINCAAPPYHVVRDRLLSNFLHFLGLHFLIFLEECPVLKYWKIIQ